MAIYNGRILMRKGNEADFDPEKMMSGEWAISLDKGIVRICLQAGTCIRMATYEAFEEDMLAVENILKECQSIEEAVRRINTEINAKVDAVVEYVGQAKTYRDEAKAFRDEAEQFKNKAGEIAGIDIATTEKAGIVKPDGKSITVDADGTIHSVGGGGGTTNYNDLSNKPSINNVVLKDNLNTADLGIDYTDISSKPKINGVELNGDLSSSDLNISLGTVDYEKLDNIPKINGVELKGDKSTADFNIDYSDLNNKPSINGTELNGNKTLDDLGIVSKTKVERLETELEKTTYKVDTVIANIDLGIKETASGENIHLTDSAEGKAVEYALYGKAEQNTTSGKNLFDNTATSKTLNNVTFTVNKEDGSVTANGTASANTFFVLKNFNLEAGSYILSGCPSGGSADTYSVNCYQNNNEFICRNIGGDSRFTTDGTTNANNRLEIKIASGLTVNNLTFYPMIRLASITDNTYEPYTNGASPNPDYPQEIEVSGESGSVEVKSVGKNLINQICVFSNDVANKKHFLKAGKYTITRDSIENGKNWYLSAYDENGTIITTTAIKSKSWGLSGSQEYYYGGSSADTIDVELLVDCYFKVGVLEGLGTTYFMLTKGDKYKPYEPYKETLATISTPNGLAGIKVSSNGNYTDQNGQQWICDEVVKYADGSGEYIQRIKKVKATVDNCTFSTTLENVTRFSINTSIKEYNENISGISSHLIYKNSWGDDSPHWYIYNGVIYFFMPNEIANDLISLSNWLNSGNSIDFLCYMKEPIETPLTAEEIAEIEKLQTFYPVTNISNDFDCGMKVTYVADSKNYIDNQLAKMEQAREQAMMSMFLLLPEETQATMIENDVNNLLTESEN